MHHIEDKATPAAVSLETARINRNYGAMCSSFYTVICQIDRSFGAKKLTDADILLFQLKLFGPGILLTST